MRDDDRMLNLTDAQFGSGIVGVCDICGERQAVVVLTKERFKLCVLDFLNKTWLKTDKKPGVPPPLYRSERATFETGVARADKAQAIVLSPTKKVKHPVVLITPDTFGITTTLLDAAIRFAREGFEVLIPDLVKSDQSVPSLHLAMRSSAQFRGGVAVSSPRVAALVRLYADALDYLRSREMVDPAKAAVFGTSYGGSLALALAAQETRLAAVALAYPMPVRPPDLANLVTAPLLYVRGSADRATMKAWDQLVAAQSATRTTFEFVEVPGARHNFLSRDLPSYKVGAAEAGWSRILAFLTKNLIPPPPKPPVMPPKPAAAAAPPPAAPKAPIAPATPTSTPKPAAPPAPSSGSAPA
ncbi:MAG TPA: dienelactone hydrolase family protein [Thermoplasmata archaeon]|jgi:dienelactone hydrolase|nr:dienelactone hydrolase family protein [Thermoplasmata archaeon]